MDENNWLKSWGPAASDPIKDILALKETMLAEHRDYLERRAKGYVVCSSAEGALMIRVPTWEQIAEIEAREP